MNKSKTSLPVLSFVLLDSHLCIDLSYIIKVLPLLKLESIPNSNAYIAGLMNIEGKISPVIDLALRLGMQRKQLYTLDTPILYCHHETEQAGLIVDKIIGLRTIDRHQIQHSMDTNLQQSSFLGSVNIDGNMSLLINIQALFPIPY